MHGPDRSEPRRDTKFEVRSRWTRDLDDAQNCILILQEAVVGVVSGGQAPCHKRRARAPGLISTFTDAALRTA